MQQQQRNYLWLTAMFLLLSAVIAGAVAADPLLSAPNGPCDARTADPDYVPGTDVNGNPVAPADLPAPKLTLREGVLVPLGHAGKGRHARPQILADLDRNDLDSILNPKPACPPEKR